MECSAEGGLKDSLNESCGEMTEKEYRLKISETFDRIEKAFAEVDPDVVECEQSQGAMTLTLADGSRCILSAQPSVLQLWLALASRGVAFHFNCEQGGWSYVWKDDKGKGIELFSYLTSYLNEVTKLEFKF